jgi:uncharacterized membrane protein
MGQEAEMIALFFAAVIAVLLVMTLAVSVGLFIVAALVRALVVSVGLFIVAALLSLCYGFVSLVRAGGRWRQSRRAFWLSRLSGGNTSDGPSVSSGKNTAALKKS